ncbi:MAG: GH36-type glycosyl hydrolase domain-containing protein [Candidatus Scatosoma sp.]
MSDFTTIIKEVRKLKSEKDERGKLPSNCYFLTEDEVVCFPRAVGDSRRPYSCDGLVLWAYSSGNIKIEESTFNVNLDFFYGQEPKIAFYFGEKRSGDFIPVSVTGAGINPLEEKAERYCVFADDGAYYFAESGGIVGGVKAYVDEYKRIRFDLYLENESGKAKETYFSAYFDLLLLHKLFEDIETKWYRTVEKDRDGFLVSVTEYLDRTTCLYHFASIKRNYDRKVFSTTSPTEFKGGQSVCLSSAKSLRTGETDGMKSVTNFNEPAVSADVSPLCLKSGESARCSYIIALSSDKSKFEKGNGRDGKIEEFHETYRNIPHTEFVGNGLGVSDFVLSAFLKNVEKQVEFCARAKNYAGPLIGVRDIFQQLEAAMLWIPDYCRKKIVEALGFIGDDGRPPRQYSYPDKPSVLPAMDLREYIDQGVWIISTVYRYLSLTGDYSILNEICGYYKFDKRKTEFSSRRDSVLDHLVAICDYLISNLDDKTGCLHVLYGDWNDALDGLGKTDDEAKEFGTGVSVMATLQLYKNLAEMIEIFELVGKFPHKAKEYSSAREKIAEGIKKYAVVEKDGAKKIVHGWGDGYSFQVGSFCDNDGLSRDSVTSNAFFVLSGMIEKYPEMKKHILAAYDRLDSEYGIKTFEPYFAPDNEKVGRITHLPEGTAENGATYVHATLFAIWSLFEAGESKRAWEQLKKILPITHGFISTTPFVMPNSFILNRSLGLDGESMSDWFTGSGCVLIKTLYFCIFGMKANLDGLTVDLPDSLPFEKMKTKLCIKGGEIEITYENKNAKRRTVYIDGETQKCGIAEIKNADVFGKKIKVEVID